MRLNFIGAVFDFVAFTANFGGLGFVKFDGSKFDMYRLYFSI
ncbi:hypothetical protein [Campylobacter showae]|uniref:Uncharacterized protein n=1 Tax=Campylobacter showae RM3277 TaxID=553219 RepID=C6RGF6_9BACT|nr:hypothetical protein [Campylobacter showae]EET79506.1 hypothetical protein CAMSH0001_0609 [Campylobacter showae RM3277]